MIGDRTRDGPQVGCQSSISVRPRSFTPTAASSTNMRALRIRERLGQTFKMRDGPLLPSRQSLLQRTLAVPMTCGLLHPEERHPALGALSVIRHVAVARDVVAPVELSMKRHHDPVLHFVSAQGAAPRSRCPSSAFPQVHHVYVMSNSPCRMEIMMQPPSETIGPCTWPGAKYMYAGATLLTSPMVISPSIRMSS